MNNEELHLEISQLKERIGVLENLVNQNSKLPKTNLLSDSFIKRAFAVLGHYIIAGLIIAIPFYLLTILIIVFLSR
jgi:hypothetical protein